MLSPDAGSIADLRAEVSVRLQITNEFTVHIVPKGLPPAELLACQLAAQLEPGEVIYFVPQGITAAGCPTPLAEPAATGWCWACGESSRAAFSARQWTLSNKCQKARCIGYIGKYDNDARSAAGSAGSAGRSALQMDEGLPGRLVLGAVEATGLGIPEERC